MCWMEIMAGILRRCLMWGIKKRSGKKGKHKVPRLRMSSAARNYAALEMTGSLRSGLITRKRYALRFAPEEHGQQSTARGEWVHGSGGLAFRPAGRWPANSILLETIRKQK